MTLTARKIRGVFATSFKFGPPTYFISHHCCMVCMVLTPCLCFASLACFGSFKKSYFDQSFLYILRTQHCMILFVFSLDPRSSILDPRSSILHPGFLGNPSLSVIKQLVITIMGSCHHILKTKQQKKTHLYRKKSSNSNKFNPGLALTGFRTILPCFQQVNLT